MSDTNKVMKGSETRSLMPKGVGYGGKKKRKSPSAKRKPAKGRRSKKM